MSLIPSYTKQFEKDLKLCKKRKMNIEKLKDIISKLIEKIELPKKNKNHKLIGSNFGRRECHLETGWLLIYKIQDDEIIFERTGTHSDLFD